LIHLLKGSKMTEHLSALVLIECLRADNVPVAMAHSLSFFYRSIPR